MAIDFGPERWNVVKENYEKWWEGELDRPLIQASLSGKDPGRPVSELPFYNFTAFYDLEVPAEIIVDSWDYYLSGLTFLGDNFPQVFPNFGAGVTAALLGCVVDVRRDEGNVWFHPPKHQAIKDIHLQYDSDNVWLKRIKEVMQAAVDRWEGAVQVSMTDLGGNLDILSSFRPGEELLYDLYDCPEEVKRVTDEANALWHGYFEELDAIVRPTNPGYTAWASILSQKSYYMLQCDFCYMISPEMFDEFVKPELAATCKKLDRPFYHLDGPGQLAHLDSMLKIEELAGIQWIPGAGNPPVKNWPQVIRKIRDAGKFFQFYGLGEDLEIIANELGSAEGIIMICPTGSPEQEDEIMTSLEKFKVI